MISNGTCAAAEANGKDENYLLIRFLLRRYKLVIHRILHLQDTNKHVQFILSNEGEFAKIQDCCEVMQNYVRAPLKITASKTVAKKVRQQYCPLC